MTKLSASEASQLTVARQLTTKLTEMAVMQANGVPLSDQHLAQLPQLANFADFLQGSLINHFSQPPTEQEVADAQEEAEEVNEDSEAEEKPKATARRRGKTSGEDAKEGKVS